MPQVKLKDNEPFDIAIRRFKRACEKAGVLAEVVNDDGTMSRLPELIDFCEEHDLLLISIADLIRYRRANERLVDPVAQSRMPTIYGDFTSHVFRDFDGQEHVALVHGQIMDLIL